MTEQEFWLWYYPFYSGVDISPEFDKIQTLYTDESIKGMECADEYIAIVSSSEFLDMREIIENAW